MTHNIPTRPAATDEFVVLVDENDKAWGKLEKQLVHELGLLHRAFSVFVFNSRGELLLQQRAEGKYHSGGLWTNTCCSHPRYGELLEDAAARRLQEEMGMSCRLDYAFAFRYRVNFGNGLTEHEYDHVYWGVSDAIPVPDDAEVQRWAYRSLDDIRTDLATDPGRYTHWFQLVFDRVARLSRRRSAA